MLFANTFSKNTVLRPGKELRVSRLRAFRAEIGLALAAADSVMVDLRATKRFDSWALLAIIDLALTFSPRLTFVVPNYLRASLRRIDSRAELADLIVSA